MCHDCDPLSEGAHCVVIAQLTCCFEAVADGVATLVRDLDLSAAAHEGLSAAIAMRLSFTSSTERQTIRENAVSRFETEFLLGDRSQRLQI